MFNLANHSHRRLWRDTETSRSRTRMGQRFRSESADRWRARSGYVGYRPGNLLAVAYRSASVGYGSLIWR